MSSLVASPRAILVAVSFSETSRAALMLAARLARPSDADVHVVYAEDPLLDTAAEHAGIAIAADTREQLDQFIAEAWPLAQAWPQAHVVTGPPVEVILDLAHRHGVDLVVVGCCGMSRAERLVFGSLTEGLLRQSDISVLVTPSGWQPPPLPEAVRVNTVRAGTMGFRALAAATMPVLMQVIDLL